MIFVFKQTQYISYDIYDIKFKYRRSKFYSTTKFSGSVKVQQTFTNLLSPSDEKNSHQG